MYRCRSRPSSAPGWSRACRSPITPATWTSARCSSASGGSSRPGAGRAQPRGTGRDRGPAAAADVAGAGADRGAAAGRGRARLLPVRQRGRRPDRARRRRRASGSGSRSRASAGTGRLCLADFFRPRSSGETDVVAFQLVTIGPRDQRGHRRAVRQARLPRLPGAARAVGAARRGAGRVLARQDQGRRSASPAATRPTWTRSCGSATRAAGTPSATRPARTWRTGRR